MIRMARLLADCPTHICLPQRAGCAKLMSPNKDETAVYVYGSVCFSAWFGLHF